VLSDLLPDESETGLWPDWRSEGRIEWLPPLGLPVQMRKSRLPFGVLIAACDAASLVKTVAPVLANGLDGKVFPWNGREPWRELMASLAGARNILLETSDPVLAGLAADAAARSDGRVIICSRRANWGMRKYFWRESEAWLGFPSDRISPVLRRIVQLMRQPLRSAGGELPNATWAAWLAAQIEPPAGGDFAGVARFLMREHPGRIWGGASDESDGPAVAVDRWLGHSLRLLWQQGDGAALAIDLAAALAWLARVAESAPDSRALQRLHARVAAWSAVPAEVEKIVRVYADAGGGVADSLPATVALIWQRRGLVREAQDLLTRWPCRGGAGFAAFLYAVAWQGADDEAKALAAMHEVRQLDPKFWGEPCAIDARWALAAVVLRRAGAEPESARYRALADRYSQASEHFLDLYAVTSPGRSDNLEQWKEFFGR
jgi:hypothetical protein